MIKKIKRIVIPMITTVLIAGSCMVVSAGTERDSITSGGLTMEYSVTATDHRASAGASVKRTRTNEFGKFSITVI